jgi:hypothetical protein
MDGTSSRHGKMKNVNEILSGNTYLILDPAVLHMEKMYKCNTYT